MLSPHEGVDMELSCFRRDVFALVRHWSGCALGSTDYLPGSLLHRAEHDVEPCRLSLQAQEPIVYLQHKQRGLECWSLMPGGRLSSFQVLPLQCPGSD